MNQLNKPWPDLILLGQMLPGDSGTQFAKHLKRESMTRDISVVMLAARGEEEDCMRGLEADADNYITRLFSPEELVARIKAVMRRTSLMTTEEAIEIQGLSLDPASHRVMTGEEPLEMGPTESKLLRLFMAHLEYVYSREQLLSHVWETNVYIEDHTIDVHIRHLRKALEPGGHDRMVQTVCGIGYRFSTRSQHLVRRTQDRAYDFLTGTSYMLERLSWRRLVLELLLCCLPAFILGVLFGCLPWFLLVSVTGLLIWYFWNLLRFP